MPVPLIIPTLVGAGARLLAKKVLKKTPKKKTPKKDKKPTTVVGKSKARREDKSVKGIAKNKKHKAKLRSEFNKRRASEAKSAKSVKKHRRTAAVLSKGTKTKLVGGGSVAATSQPDRKKEKKNKPKQAVRSLKTNHRARRGR